jgi:hypothetical protein
MLASQDAAKKGEKKQFYLMNLFPQICISSFLDKKYKSAY